MHDFDAKSNFGKMNESNARDGESYVEGLTGLIRA